MERDFLAYYGLDLLDLFREESHLTPDRALRLIRNLPDESHTVAMRSGGPEFLGWNRTTTVLADVFDAIQGNTHALVLANTDKQGRKKVQEPTPYPRPGADTQSRKGQSNSFAAMARAKLQSRRGKG